MRVFNPRKLRYAKAIDAAGRWLFRIFRGKQTEGLAPVRDLEPGAILVIESHLIGDIVMAVPALARLRRRYPSARIVFVAGPWGKALLNGQGLVDEFVVIRFPWSTYDYSPENLLAGAGVLGRLRRERWDLGIDLRGDIRNIAFLSLTRSVRRMSYDFTGGEYLLTDPVSAPPSLRHVVEYNGYLMDQLGCPAARIAPSLTVTDRQRADARFRLQREGCRGDGLLIGIHPGASKPLRLWSSERFARLADRFLEDPGNGVVLFEGPSDADVVREIAERMSRTPVVIRCSLEELPSVFEQCALLVGLDSGAVHIAAAVGVPTVVLFGPAEPDRVRPISDRSAVVIQDGYRCRPCDQVHCVQPENNCMDALEVESVYARSVALIREHPANRPAWSRPS